MYRCIFLGIAFFTANMALSQQVFGAAGNENYTLGEVFINSHISSNQILSEGFHQPVISLFEIESIDHADSAVSQISISVDYENFTMNPNVNAYISEDEMKRYSDFNKGEWNLKQNGNPEQANTPGGYQDHKETLSTTERKLSFLNGDGSTDIGRKQQVQFLDSFSNNE